MAWQVLARQLLGQALESGSKSTVVKSLQGMMALLLAALVGGYYFGVPETILKILVGMICLDFVVFIGAYIYFAITDRDALRSETYSLRKMVIERGLQGDSISGLFVENSSSVLRTAVDPTTQLIESAETKRIEERP